MDSDEFMNLGETAISALDIFVTGEQGSSTYSLYGLLNKCRTIGGKDLLKEWLKKPLYDLHRISHRLDIVEALNDSSECRDSLHNHLLRKIHDLSSLARKLASNKATLEDCYKLYKGVCMLESMLEALSEIEGRNSVEEFLLAPLRRSQRELEKLRDLIEASVIFNELTQTYCVNPELDENLISLQEEVGRIKTKAEAEVIKLRAETDTDLIKLESNSEIGFFFRTTAKGEKGVRNSNIKTLTSTKGGGVTFTNSALERLSKDFCTQTSEYEEAQKEVRDNVIETCCGYSEACDSLAQKIGFLDVLVSFSVHCSSSANQYVRPELLEKGTNVFELRDCRHPIVESIPFAPSFIPNDVYFEDGHRFTVLTGPNMGGKSTYLKSAAVSVILAQIGCFVPCSSARFSLIDSIFCRIGAGDVQAKGISTFMQEMLDAAEILTNAGDNSLVVIDEMGRGTSTFDGFGLAFTVAEQIIFKKKCFTIFATHFHEMAQLKSYYPDAVQNLKMETHMDEDGTMTILYRTVEGISEQSFGISIARMVGFPEDITKEAEENLKELEQSNVSEEELTAQKTLASFQQMNAEEIRFVLRNLPEDESV